MDDSEYYSLMNRSSAWALQQELKKKQQQKDTKKVVQENLKKESMNYTNLELRQGKADAEMLLEKNKE